MINSVKCPNCGQEVEISEAISHELSEKSEAKAKEQFELTVKNLRQESQEAAVRNKQLQEQLLDLSKQLRKTMAEKEDQKLDLEKRLLAEQEKLRIEAQSKAEESYKLQIAEMNKKLADVARANEDLKTKLQQGSQQLQGEVQEEDLKTKLIEAFPADFIEDVEKGVKGADLRQTVKSNRGNTCGVILWESKRTKSWSDEWLFKLKEDLRNSKAHVPVLVSSVLPKDIVAFGIKDGVYLCEPRHAIVLAEFLRKHLIEVAYQKFLSQNQGGKAEQVYNYLIGHEFRQQVEALVEVYRDMLDQINRERVVLEKQLKVRETQVQRMMKSTVNIYGSIQGLAGSSLPTVPGLELPESTNL